MADHPSTQPSEHNLPIQSVGEISVALKRHIEGAFDRVRVRGEVTGFKRAASGHLYFSLKDADAVLDAVCWRGAAASLGTQPEDGMEVVANGRLTTFAGRSKYQVVVDGLELAGEGALLKLLEERRKRLADEGLFDAERKRPLPFLPEVIGVVTSPTGAVIRDILHRLADRFPRRVLLWPVLVQGDGAAAQIAAAIDGFGRLPPDGPVPRPDLVVVARGGGSLEDLWAFNEEVVVRAAAACPIPLISAVGHETDTTLIDFAADRRAPTPTAAAEIAVPVRAELLAQVMDDGARLFAAADRRVRDGRVRIDGLARGLPRLDRLLGEARQRLDDRAERLANALGVGHDRRRARLAEAAGRLADPRPRIEHARSRLAAEARALATAGEVLLRRYRDRLEATGALFESLSYERVLERGYAIVQSGERVVAKAAGVSPGMGLTLRFQDGTVAATADGTPAARPRARRRGGETDQGDLF